MRETVNFRGVIQIENKTRRNDQFSFFFLAGGARGHREGSVGTVKHWCLYWEDKIN